MWFSIFMASSTSSACPASTVSPTFTSTFTIVPCIGAVTVPSPPLPVDAAAFGFGARLRTRPRRAPLDDHRGVGQPELHAEALAVDLDRDGALDERSASAVGGRRPAEPPGLGREPGQVDLVLEPVGRVVAGGEVGVLEHELVRGDRRVDPVDLELAAAPAACGDGPGRGPAPTPRACRAGCRSTARSCRPLRTRRPSARPGPRRDAQPADRARRREEALGRVLGVDPDLDRVAAPLDRVLRERQRLAVRDPDLLGDEVERRHHLGDAVLDLQPGVHLEEVELAVLDRRPAGRASRRCRRSRSRTPWPPSPRPRPSRRASSRSGPRPGSPRPASGAGAAPSSRARRATPRCRGCRRRSASRCGAAGAGTSRGTPRSGRSTPAPRAARSRAPTARAPRPRRPSCPARRRRTRP